MRGSQSINRPVQPTARISLCRLLRRHGTRDPQIETLLVPAPEPAGDVADFDGLCSRSGCIRRECPGPRPLVTRQ